MRYENDEHPHAHHGPGPDHGRGRDHGRPRGARFNRPPWGDDDIDGPGGRFPGPGRGPRRGRGGGRARRGDVRAAALALLAERPMHGYEMIQVLEERTGGLWKPSPGSIYPALQLLEDQGLIAADESTGRRLFTLTDAGREAVASEDRGATPWDEVTAGIDPDAVQLRHVVHGIMMAARQVGEAGTPAQSAKAVEILTEARRRIYAILAEAD